MGNESMIAKGMAIRTEVCKALGVLEKDLLSKSRKLHVTEARFITAFMLKDHVKLTLKQTAGIIGLNDHSSVIYALKVCGDRLFSSVEFQSKVEQVKISLKQLGYDR